MEAKKESKTDQEATKVSGHLKRGVMCAAYPFLIAILIVLRWNIRWLKSKRMAIHTTEERIAYEEAIDWYHNQKEST